MVSSVQLSVVRAWPRATMLTAVFVSFIAQLYRWWLQRRRQRKCIASCSQDATCSSSGVDAIKARSHIAAAPPPRPGVDVDERFEMINDDPRYFAGASLGKTQRAVLGQAFESGVNTVSFDPASTLVRPSMRIVHGMSMISSESAIAVGMLKPDDIVGIPDFLGEDGQRRMYQKLVGDIDALAGSSDMSASCSYKGIVEEVSRCFTLSEVGRKVSLVWYRDASDEHPFRSTSTDDQEDSGDFDCMATLTLGAACEFVYRRTDFCDKLSFPSENGSLFLLGRDVCCRWQRDIEQIKGGLVLITVLGKTPIAAAETVLSPMPPPTSCVLKGGGECDKTLGASRPSMRIRIVTDITSVGRISHDDAIIIPTFFCEPDDWNMYYSLLKEMRECQAREDRNSQWESWHEGAHLLTKNPTGSATYNDVLAKICDHFAIANSDCRDGNSVGTRFNWYRDGSDWKPFHHDSAAFNIQRARQQNCTVGISFGASRELAFRHAKTGELIYVPQTNGMLFFFGRDVNIRWQHGINALPKDEQDGKGRISIILWGLSTLAFEEEGSPSMLVDSYEGNTRNKGSGKGYGKSFGKGGAEICRNFRREGRCSFGDRCKYIHSSAHSGRQHGGG